MITESCDVLVIGGGHAGAEAAWAAANLGARTILVTHSRDAIGRMSCNPAIGGIGKGQMVREVDALGGLMGLVTDETGIQFRMLNRGKGPAVWAPRAQADRELYAAVLQRYLAHCANLTILEAGVDEILAEPRTLSASAARVTGVMLSTGRIVRASAIVLASGTFLRGLMHTGEQQAPGGRIDEPAAMKLSASLQAFGLQLGRLKTGTPPRIARESVDFSRVTPQPGDERPCPFSFLTTRIVQPQVCCWLTTTTPEVHQLIRANLHRAPLYSGQIQSTGPRYCPSIETKVVRFPEKTSHQIFLEPEGRASDRIYVNGVSTSLPLDVQREMIALIPGLERARIVQWGYAIEYDFVPPDQIDASLMTKRVAGLFLAGQINGTSGYEEAAGQGVVAGINSARFVSRMEPIIIGRDEAYIGVMIDDLVTRGVIEPYRMFSSRAEHRMHLRYDNADARLTPLGRQVGLVQDDRWAQFTLQQDRLRALLTALATVQVEHVSLRDRLKRPEESGDRFRQAIPEISRLADDDEVWERARVIVKYDGYIERQSRMISQFRELENSPIPTGIDYGRIPHLRREAVERWSAILPRSIGQAARVSGVHPTDVNLLVVYLSAGSRDGECASKSARLEAN